MNNQNPYQQQPGQPMPPAQPGQPIQPGQQPIPPMPPMPPYQYAPMKPKMKFFDAEMAEILACAVSTVGLALSIVSTSIAGNVTYIYGMIMVIVSMIISVGGFVFNLVLGNKKRMRGEPRGTLLSWGLIFAFTGIILFAFVIFYSGCMTCYTSKLNIRF